MPLRLCRAADGVAIFIMLMIFSAILMLMMPLMPLFFFALMPLVAIIADAADDFRCQRAIDISLLMR